MFAKIGRKLIQGAKAEIEESPPTILDQDRWMNLLEMGLTLGLLAVTILGSLRSNKQPVTVIVNNYIQGGSQV